MAGSPAPDWPARLTEVMKAANSLCIGPLQR